ncbi:MAG: pilin [Candidatus Parcubacteria bacterium]|nr:pilin [Candidatus Parcubacteria bacterium]
MKVKLFLLIFGLALLSILGFTDITLAAFVTSGSCPAGSVQVSCPGGSGPTCCEWEVVEEPAPPPDEPVCPAPPADPSDNWTDRWSEYMCQDNSCGGNIISKDASQYCNTECTGPIENGVDADGCLTYHWDCEPTQCDPVEYSPTGPPYPINATAPAWASCKGSADWSKTSPSFGCTGSCIEEAPTNPTPSDKKTGVSLPIDETGDTVTWDNVSIWGKEYGPLSYLVKIINTNTEKVASLPSATFEACSFQSNTQNTWQAQACCTADGTDCGLVASTWNFKTTMPPELVYPLDPDQSGPNFAEGILSENRSDPILDWCDVPDAKSYLLNIYLIKDGETICHPWLGTADEGCRSKVITLEKRLPPFPSQEKLYSEFIDNIGFFTNSTRYVWEVATCLLEKGFNCSEFSQKWAFDTSPQSLLEFLLIYPFNDPEGKQPVGLPVTLEWEDKPGTNSFIYQINPGNISNFVAVSQLQIDFPQLSLDTLYNWKIKPCKDYLGKQCEDYWIGPWYFKTTGATTSLESPINGAVGVLIPIKLNWGDVGGAESYIVKVWGNALNIEKYANGSELDLNYPEFNIRQENDYSWQVKTCSHQEGKDCGKWSEIRKFTTFKLSAPLNPNPEDGGELPTYQHLISWDKVSGEKAYQYKITYLSMADSEKNTAKCSPLVGKEVIPTKTVSTISDRIILDCLGGYQWQVQACLDDACTEIGNPSLWRFNLVERKLPPGGLIPCGRDYDDPSTAWFEDEPCEIKHLFLLLKIILDFLLWRLVPIIIVLLVAAIGAMYYLSFGMTDLISRARATLRAAIIGYAILIFAWFIINWILIMFGVTIKWWIINF